MPKSAVAKKAKPKKAPSVNTSVVHDIINTVKSNQEKMEQKLDSLARMCSGEKCRIK